MDPDELFKTLDSRTSRLVEDVAEIKSDLRFHIKRTELNEENLELLRKDFAPLKTHVAVVGALVKGLGVVGTLVGIAVGVAKLLGVG